METQTEEKDMINQENIKEVEDTNDKIGIIIYYQHRYVKKYTVCNEFFLFAYDDE